MADTVTSSNVLTLGFQRSDNSVQKITIPDCVISGKTAASSSEIASVRSAMSYLTQNNLILDSKTQEVLSETSILTAYVDNVTKIGLDFYT